MPDSALLLMDVQNSIVERFADSAPSLLEALGRAAAAARALVPAGIATSGVVLSTLRQAADLDYGLVVLRDGCVDADEEVHRVLLDKVFPRQADVLAVDQWVAGMQR